MTESGEQASTGDDVLAGLEAWRAGIGARAHPVRLRRIESLARRTADMPQGPARRILEQKLATLMCSSPAQGATTQADAIAKAAAPSQRGQLAELAALLSSRSPSHALNKRAPSGETELLRHMHKIWSRLSAERRLTQSLAKVPDKAGPLNSHHLVHRALAAMREASPGYFHHFVSQVDALLALDQMMQAINSPAPAAVAASAAPARQRKGGRTKAT